MDMNLIEGMLMSEFSLWAGRQGHQLKEGWVGVRKGGNVGNTC